MGEYYGIECPNCSFKFKAAYGSGFLFSKIYENTLAEMKKGAFGERAKIFFQENPNGAIDCEKTLLQCRHCGTLENRKSLDMYIPKTDYKQAEDSTYETRRYLKQNYILKHSFYHRCCKCGKRMRKINEQNLMKIIDKGDLKCPVCKSSLKINFGDCWTWD